MHKIPPNLKLRSGEEMRLWEEISKKPDKISNYRQLSRLLNQRNRPCEAVIPLRLALKNISQERLVDKKEIKKRIARLYEDAGDVESAIRNYRNLIREYPDTVILYERLENIYKKLGRPDEMVKILKGIDKDNPSRERLWKRLIRFETELGRLRAAKEDLELLIAVYGPDFKLRKDLGRLYQKLGDFKQAIVNYQKALEFKPRDPDLSLLIGILQRKLGMRSQASETFKEILVTKPDWYGSHINLAEMDIEDGNFSGAEDHFRKIDARFPGNSRVMINRADMLIAEGKPEEALAVCLPSSSITPFYYTDELSLGHRVLRDAYTALGNEEEAAYHDLLARKIKGSSDFFATLVEVVDEKIAAGDLEMAEKVVDGILSRFPMNSLAYLKKAEIARIRGKLDEAITYAAQAAREKNPRFLKDRIKGLEILSKLYRDKGMVDDSDRYLKKARQFDGRA